MCCGLNREDRRDNARVVKNARFATSTVKGGAGLGRRFFHNIKE